jgi:hypothetical protein
MKSIDLAQNIKLLGNQAATLTGGHPVVTIYHKTKARVVHAGLLQPQL